jgi:hypothetical protein
MEVPYFLMTKLVLLWTELQEGFLEQLEHFPQVEQLLLGCVENHNHVFQIHKT